MSPLVTVMIPCHGDRDTLPMALASMLAQSLQDWQVIVVDDGNDPPLHPIIKTLDDPRIELIRLPQNRGRGFARAEALQRCRGEFLTFCDADDWLYPDKLTLQVEHLRQHPQLALLSCAAAVIDRQDKLLGLRLPPDPSQGTWRGLGSLPFNSAGSMIRSELARQAGFDRNLRAAEDADFLQRVVSGRRYDSLPQVLYSYREIPTLPGTLRALRDQRRSYAHYLTRRPLESLQAQLGCLLREALYPIIWRLHLQDAWIARRNSPASPADHRRHQQALATIQRF